MDFHWKIKDLMEQWEIQRTSKLAQEIKQTCPDLHRTISDRTLKRMLNNDVIEIKAVGIIAICRYFRLHTLAQLVDFDTAPPPNPPPHEPVITIGVTFKLQDLIKELNLSQTQVTERSRCSPGTISGLYHGRNTAINFRVLKQVAEAVYDLTPSYFSRCRPYSITELVEITTQETSDNKKLLVCHR
ncbi:helix-turn-helix domain-containing protein [Leptolyngbya sp. AN03gr2]|uniref:helix-turn-helix domain-containing protein n=1 Tax=unclassified Leptolyngbya TaxID=2650499 RepID=UPI003D314A95